METIVKKYKFRIYPSKHQELILSKIFGSVRFIYNEFLRINNDMWEDENITRLSRIEMQELLIMYKDIYPWLKKSPSQTLQVATHDLDVAYQNFFSKRSGLPKFKKTNSNQSFHLPQPKTRYVDGVFQVGIPNNKTWIHIHKHREFPKDCKIGSATITKSKTGKYFISFVVSFEYQSKIDSKNPDMVGIDLNINSIVISNGRKIEIPKPIKTLEIRKRRIQQSLSRQIKNSNNYRKNLLLLNKLYERIKLKKEDFFHKTAISIFRENQSVAMETLNVKGMLKNRKLSKSISNSSWGRFVEIMKMYAKQENKTLVFISQWFPSSKKCSSCGEINHALTLSMREWMCDCGVTHDRDINAAINIKNEGGSYPVKLVEKKGSVFRFRKKTTMSSEKQESSECKEELCPS